jgi:hypothetical protein
VKCNRHSEDVVAEDLIDGSTGHRLHALCRLLSTPHHTTPHADTFYEWSVANQLAVCGRAVKSSEPGSVCLPQSLV